MRVKADSGNSGVVLNRDLRSGERQTVDRRVFNEHDFGRAPIALVIASIVGNKLFIHLHAISLYNLHHPVIIPQIQPLCNL